jgi:hypothetical protein
VSIARFGPKFGKDNLFYSFFAGIKQPGKRGIAESKVPRISHEHVPLIDVDTVEKGTACNVSCIERAAEHARETRFSQDQNPETSPQYFTMHDELDFDESGDERNYDYDESWIVGTVVTLPDGSTLSSRGGNQTSLTFHGKQSTQHDLEHFEVVEPLHKNSGHIAKIKGISPLNIAYPYTLWRKPPE